MKLQQLALKPTFTFSYTKQNGSRFQTAAYTEEGKSIILTKENDCGHADYSGHHENSSCYVK